MMRVGHHHQLQQHKKEREERRKKKRKKRIFFANTAGMISTSIRNYTKLCVVSLAS